MGPRQPPRKAASCPETPELCPWGLYKKTVTTVGKKDRIPPLSSPPKTERIAAPPPIDPPVFWHVALTESLPPDLPKRLRQKDRERLDATLDLHGLTQKEAFEKLCSFIQKAHKRHDRTLRIITGKGSRTAPPTQRAVLQTMLPIWCRHAPLAPLIKRIQTASPNDGGTGAYYITLAYPSFPPI